MRKIILSTFVILSFVFYVIYQKIGSLSDIKIAESTPQSSSIETPSATPVPTDIPQIIQPSPTQVTAQGLKNGEYTGDIADAYYGNVQVKAVISGGRITDVQFLQYPSDRRTSVMINTQAMPDLKQEAIQAQNANVDIVSGATATSQAFRQSLQSALSQAQ